MRREIAAAGQDVGINSPLPRRRRAPGPSAEFDPHRRGASRVEPIPRNNPHSLIRDQPERLWPEQGRPPRSAPTALNSSRKAASERYRQTSGNGGHFRIRGRYAAAHLDWHGMNQALIDTPSSK